MDLIRPTLLTLQTGLNFLLPFARPGTPLYLDVLHTLLLCTLLYFAPHILERWAAHRISQTQNPEPQLLAPEAQPATNRTPPRLGDHEAQAPHHDAPPPIPSPALHPPAPPAEMNPDNEDAPPFPARPTPSTNRPLGAKKAKSLARKDQRRAYHEFMRSQGEAQRAADAAGQAEREEALAEERRRRADVEREIGERKERERRERSERERRERDERAQRERRVVGKVREGLATGRAVDLREIGVREGMGMEEIDRVVRASGVLGVGEMEGEKGVTMMTGGGWVVRVRERDMREVYRRITQMPVDEIGEDGKVGFEKLGRVLEKVITAG